jgi:hypothetical protein
MTRFSTTVIQKPGTSLRFSLGKPAYVARRVDTVYHSGRAPVPSKGAAEPPKKPATDDSVDFDDPDDLVFGAQWD